MRKFVLVTVYVIALIILADVIFYCIGDIIFVLGLPPVLTVIVAPILIGYAIVSGFKKGIKKPNEKN